MSDGLSPIAAPPKKIPTRAILRALDANHGSVGITAYKLNLPLRIVRDVARQRRHRSEGYQDAIGRGLDGRLLR